MHFSFREAFLAFSGCASRPHPERDIPDRTGVKRSPQTLRKAPTILSASSERDGGQGQEERRAGSASPAEGQLEAQAWRGLSLQEGTLQGHTCRREQGSVSSGAFGRTGIDCGAFRGPQSSPGWVGAQLHVLPRPGSHLSLASAENDAGQTLVQDPRPQGASPVSQEDGQQRSQTCLGVARSHRRLHLGPARRAQARLWGDHTGP